MLLEEDDRNMGAVERVRRFDHGKWEERDTERPKDPNAWLNFAEYY